MRTAGGANEQNEMKTDAIILAAGRGERLGELTKDQPKCLLELTPGVTLLDAQITGLLAAGYVRRIVVAIGYRAEKVRAHVTARYSNSPVEVIEIPDFVKRNNAHTLRETLLDNMGKNILEVNGDTYCDPRVFTEAAAVLASCPSTDARVFVRPAVCAEEEMKVQLRHDGTIGRLHKTIDPASGIGEAFGITYFGSNFAHTLPRSLKRVVDTSAQAYFEDGINEHIAKGHVALPHLIGERVAVEVDLPEDLESARRMYASVKPQN